MTRSLPSSVTSNMSSIMRGWYVNGIGVVKWGEARARMKVEGESEDEDEEDSLSRAYPYTPSPIPFSPL